MSEAIQQAFEQFNEMIHHMGKHSHHTAQEYSKAVKMFVDLYLAGERPHPDDVKH
jgi:hypothetical protein